MTDVSGGVRRGPRSVEVVCLVSHSVRVESLGTRAHTVTVWGGCAHGAWVSRQRQGVPLVPTTVLRTLITV